MAWKVPYVNLKAQFENQREELTAAFTRIMETGSFILRDDVQIFESTMAQYLGVKHVIGLNSGSDALFLAVRAAGIGEGDEVITVAHTFVATLAAAHFVGATPVLVDIGEDFNMDIARLEAAITPRTKAIIPVHLNGRLCDMDAIMDVANRHNLVVIEDAAQALGGEFRGRKAGSFGLAGCFSLHPMKNLSCAGDGGFLSTNDDALAETLRMMRNHGQKSKQEIAFYGMSSRLDTLHAAILNVKFPRLKGWLERRRDIARRYNEALAGLPILLPHGPGEQENGRYDVYSSYVIRSSCQQKLLDYLIGKGIEAFVHFGPKTLSEQTTLAFKRAQPLTRTEGVAKEFMSLPIYPELSDDQIDLVISEVQAFFKANPGIAHPTR